jgi:hypothetical protein
MRGFTANNNINNKTKKKNTTQNMPAKLMYMECLVLNFQDFANLCREALYVQKLKAKAKAK